MTPEWWLDWTDETCVIVASGQSAASANVEVARGRCKAIVINSSYALAPWADVLYAADGDWWSANQSAFSFAGLKLTACERTARAFRLGLVRMSDEPGKEDQSEITIDEKGRVARGGNSGFQALNLAVQFGCRGILLVGFDLSGEHWHKPHARRPHSPRPDSLTRWAATLDRQRPILDRLGIEVVNCSMVSALKAYPKMRLEEALLPIAA